MVGGPTAVIAAIARTAAPAVLGNGRAGSPPAESSGNLAAKGGQALPPPAFDFAELVRQLDAFTENGNRSLRYRTDDLTGLTVMTVINPNTQEVIRQVPPEEAVALARILEYLRGQLLNADS